MISKVAPTYKMFYFTGVLRLVLAGRLGEAIADTQRLYPGLLESDQKLLFLLKCRQFVEMVNGADNPGVTTNQVTCTFLSSILVLLFNQTLWGYHFTLVLLPRLASHW